MRALSFAGKANIQLTPKPDLRGQNEGVSIGYLIVLPFLFTQDFEQPQHILQNIEHSKKKSSFDSKLSLKKLISQVVRCFRMPGILQGVGGPCPGECWLVEPSSIHRSCWGTCLQIYLIYNIQTAKTEQQERSYDNHLQQNLQKSHSWSSHCAVPLYVISLIWIFRNFEVW